MAATVAPIKIDQETDRLVSHAAHFLAKSKKDVVDAAVREYIDKHRDEINAGVQEALGHLDGSRRASIGLLSGLSDDEISDLGGVAE